MSQAQTMRYIILPQAMSTSVPAFMANVIFLLKETSVFSAISLMDLMFTAKDLIGLYSKTTRVPVPAGGVLPASFCCRYRIAGQPDWKGGCAMPDLGLDVLFKGKNVIRLLGGLWRGAEASVPMSVAHQPAAGHPAGRADDLPAARSSKPSCGVYLEFIRFMPQMVLLFLVYFGTTRAFGWDLSGETAAVIVFVLWGAAEMSDLVRGALIAIPKHQYESSAKRWA